MKLSEMANMIKRGDADDYFVSKEVKEKIIGRSVEEIETFLSEFTGAVIGQRDRARWELSHVYFILKWMSLFRVLEIGDDARLVELAPGENPRVLIAFDTVVSGKGSYIAVNLNRKLTSILKGRARSIETAAQFVEDDSRNLTDHVEKNTVDVVALNHAIDNILECLVAEEEGIDTVNAEYMEIFPKLIMRFEAACRSGKLKAIAHEGFMKIVADAFTVLKPNRYLIFYQFVLQEALDAGADMNMRSSLINIARDWILEKYAQSAMLEIDNYDPKRWLILKKN